MRPRLFETIARYLEADIRSKSPVTLEPTHILAAKWHTAIGTMRKALNELRLRGIISISPGQPIRVLPGEGVPQFGYLRSVERLFAQMKDDFLSGRLQAGEQIPKIDYIANLHHVSRATVCRALEKLSEGHLAHRTGKRWIVGPAAQRKETGNIQKSAQSPIVLLLLGNDQQWGNFFENGHTAPFALTFKEELSKYNMQASVVIKNKPLRGSALMPAGLQETTGFMSSLGERYEGTLIFCNGADRVGLDAWVPRLSARRKPVAYFDSTDEGTPFPAGDRRFRLFFDESAAIRLAVEALVNSGHGTIGVPVFPGLDWAERRAERIAACANQCDPPPRIIFSRHTEQFWRFANWKSMHDYVTAMRRELDTLTAQPAGRLSFHALLRNNTPSLTGLLDKGASAIIALNDVMAREYYFCFKALGIEFPRHLSIVSFDDMHESIILPLSTINFGFARLGYLAAHIFIGDIPVKADREGNIAGLCSLVDRGSIGSPRRTPALK